MPGVKKRAKRFNVKEALRRLRRATAPFPKAGAL